MSSLPAVGFGPDWERTRAKAGSEAWAAAVADGIEAEFVQERESLSFPAPELPTEWSHHYFCGETGERLRWDPLLPREHRSARKTYAGEPYDGAWRTQRHATNVIQMERCAVLLRLGRRKGEAREELERIVDFYSANYLRFAVHGKNPPPPGQAPVLAGRIQPQSLDEANWMVVFFRSVRWSGLAASWPEDRRRRVSEMARAAVDLLRPQVDKIHNIHCWMIAGIAACAGWLDDAPLLAWCREGPFGIPAQIERGFRPDGLWWEGSLTYHFYTIASILAYLEEAGGGALPAASLDRLRAALRCAPPLAYAGGRLPAYQDAWPQVCLAESVDLYEAAAGLLPGESWDETLARIYAGAPAVPLRPYSRTFSSNRTGVPVLGARSSVAALVYGPAALPDPRPDAVASYLLPDSGIGLLRNGAARVGMRFGPYGGTHDHRDLLGIDVETAAGWQSLDLGTSGYGAAFTNEWQRSPVSHNTVVIDGVRAEASGGKRLSWSEAAVSAEAAEAYPGTLLRRSVTLRSDGWDDHYSVSADRERRVEWLFHGDGLFVPEGGEGESAELEAEGGYRWLRRVRRLPGAGTVRGAWRCGGIVQRLELDLPPGFAFYWAEADGNPNGRPLGVVLARGAARGAVFAARFRV